LANYLKNSFDTPNEKKNNTANTRKKDLQNTRKVLGTQFGVVGCARGAGKKYEGRLTPTSLWKSHQHQGCRG